SLTGTRVRGDGARRKEVAVGLSISRSSEGGRSGLTPELDDVTRTSRPIRKAPSQANRSLASPSPDGFRVALHAENERRTPVHWGFCPPATQGSARRRSRGKLAQGFLTIPAAVGIRPR